MFSGVITEGVLFCHRLFSLQQHVPECFIPFVLLFFLKIKNTEQRTEIPVDLFYLFIYFCETHIKNTRYRNRAEPENTHTQTNCTGV